MRVAIIGSRCCPQIDIAAHFPFRPSLIISGGAIGADRHAREFALSHGIPLKEFLPEYEKFGRKAPLLRNLLIVDNCDFLIAFWDGKSKGTKFTLDYAKKRGIPCTIVNISN